MTKSLKRRNTGRKISQKKKYRKKTILLLMAHFLTITLISPQFVMTCLRQQIQSMFHSASLGHQCYWLHYPTLSLSILKYTSAISSAFAPVCLGQLVWFQIKFQIKDGRIVYTNGIQFTQKKIILYESLHAVQILYKWIIL